MSRDEGPIQFQRPFQILANRGRLFREMSNVIGTGVGLKITDGQITDEPCVTFFVRRKIPRELLGEYEVIPREIRNVSTDVIEAAPRTVGPTPVSASSIIESQRPARPGCSIGHYDVGAGTLGGVTQDRETGERLILSNNHVLANCNSGCSGDPVLQPGMLDGGELFSDTLATLVRATPLKLTSTLALPWGTNRSVPIGTNVADCAVASPIEEESVDPEIQHIGIPTGTTKAWPGTQVQKCGRSTGRTDGTVIAYGVEIGVDYGPSGQAGFSNVIVIQGNASAVFSRGGDSGSLILDQERRATCLLFAGDDSQNLTFANDIDTVLNLLNQDLVVNN